MENGNILNYMDVMKDGGDTLENLDIVVNQWVRLHLCDLHTKELTICFNGSSTRYPRVLPIYMRKVSFMVIFVV